MIFSHVDHGRAKSHGLLPICCASRYRMAELYPVFGSYKPSLFVREADSLNVNIKN